MTRDIDKRNAPSAGQSHPGKAEIDRQTPAFLLLQTIRVTAGECLDQSRLAVVDVASGGDYRHAAAMAAATTCRRSQTRRGDPGAHCRLAPGEHRGVPRSKARNASSPASNVITGEGMPVQESILPPGPNLIPRCERRFRPTSRPLRPPLEFDIGAARHFPERDFRPAPVGIHLGRRSQGSEARPVDPKSPRQGMPRRPAIKSRGRPPLRPAGHRRACRRRTAPDQRRGLRPGGSRVHLQPTPAADRGATELVRR